MNNIDVRLNGTDTEGFLEANEGSGWGPVCSNSFDAEVAMVACRQLRLGLPVSYRRNVTLANLPYYFMRLYCHGREQRLAECITSSYYGTCYTTYLQCSGMYVYIVKHLCTLLYGYVYRCQIRRCQC